MGSFTAELYDEIVPITANNFILLTNNGFYNNKIFHRVVAGFVIQDGCPYGTGFGGPGWTIQDEFSPLLNHNQSGTLAMARTSAPNSAGSQYYFTLAPTPGLNGNYAVFGKIIEGLENVLSIGLVPVDANNKPITPVNIYQLRMLDLRINSIYPDTTNVVCNPGEPLTFMVEAYASTAQLTYSWYVNDVLQNGQNDMVFDTVIPNHGVNLVRCNVSSSDSIAHNVEWNILSGVANSDNLNPAISTASLICYPNPFRHSLELKYTLKEGDDVSFEVFNLRGQKVKSYSPTRKAAGEWAESWDGTDYNGTPCPSGVYIVRMQAGANTIIRKSMLVRD
jgi:cyclophilin family peptidyl-prolyl cis-trans isomerase